jgi:pimeloyl-ACP methyl ester carboxylesterase
VTTFCLLHGNWHDGTCWTALVEALHERGATALAPNLPFDDASADYAARAQPALQALAGVADPVVIVAHSVSSAEAAVVAASRRPSLLVYLCPRFGSFAVPPDAPEPFQPGFPWPPRDEQGRLVWAPEAAAAAMYAHLPSDEAADLSHRLYPGAQPVGEFPLSEHPDVPTALIYTTEDEFFRPEWEQYVARDVLGIEPVELPGGHFPMIENPERLADVLVALSS